MNLNNMLTQALECQNQGEVGKAHKLFAEVLRVAPDNAVALYSLALIFLNAGRHSDALPLTARGVQTNPTFAPLWFIHGAVQQALGDKNGALQSYDTALQVKPDYLEVLTNSGVLLRNMMRHKESLERFQRVLAIDPNHQTALANSGILLTEFKQSQPAIGMFARLLMLNPDYDYGLGLLAYERLHICDWTDFAATSQRIIDGIRAGKRTCKTLALMAMSDSASDHYQAAQLFSSHYCPPSATKLWNGERYRHDKIRLAYISPDLREHPVGHLTAGIFEHHDKSRFETIAISLGIDDGSRLRSRMLKAFDRFIDVREMGSLQIAQMLREMEIDILVDLGGYTSDTRTDVLSFRPAPVQVNYLGYPGTMGVEYYDYIVADRFVISDEQMQFYSEKVAYLPDTYLPTDASVQISENTPTRAECGLPDEGFVFCAFCHDYKINPPTFDVWMRLLAQVPGSVLWLVSRNEISQHNLRKEAELRGVAAERLIFAQRVPLVEDHLARYRQANLFLDTHPYNGHTTTADALMAGLPVLTYMGSAFPSRVAGSLLHAVGMAELVTYSLQEYEAKAMQLASNPAALAEIKARLVANKAQSPLFDTKEFCRNLEAIYIAMSRQTGLGAELDELSGRKDGRR
ncbi:MAG: tetratricopeptide repeat protein [Gallionella sp.]